ncbi:hypothetical protein LCGC14_2847590 [marine sediment metagenome]|uniref:Uncharacterized protein n=1 Tax=marine sediment metagenome TaxID=412755 RepID=A0A0F8YW36_9ZZZZ
MSDYIDIDVSDAEPLSTIDDNSERELTITKAVSKEEYDAILLTLSSAEDPLAADISHFLNLSHTDGTLKQKQACAFRLKTFLETFDIPTSGGFSIEDMIGKTGTVIIGVKESDDYGKQNTIKRCVNPVDKD